MIAKLWLGTICTYITYIYIPKEYKESNITLHTERWFRILKALKIRKSNYKSFTDMIWEWCTKATIKRRWQNVIQYANFLSSHAVLSQHYYIINKRAYLKLLVFLFFNVFGICFTVLGICPHTLMLSCFVQNTLKHFDTKFHTSRGTLRFLTLYVVLEIIPKW